MPFDTMVMGKDGKLTWLYAKDSSASTHHKKRYRATVVIFRDGKVLLVKDKGRDDWSLPGGGFKKGETTIQAGIREVNEELGVKTVSAERLRQCDFEGRRAKHKVVALMLEQNAKPSIRSKEISDFTWWDMKSPLKAQGHIGYILNKLGKIEAPKSDQE